MPFVLGQCLFLFQKCVISKDWCSWNGSLFHGKNTQNLPSATKTCPFSHLQMGSQSEYNKGHQKQEQSFSASQTTFVWENSHERAEIICIFLCHLVILSLVV